MKANVRGIFKVKNNRIIKVLWLAIFCVLAFSLSPLSSAQATEYVDAAALGGTGSSWAEAHTNIQDAIDAAVAGEEIWVREGTYDLTLTSDINVNKEVQIYGGFPAGGDPGWLDRDWEFNVTTVDGGNHTDAADHCFYITEDATIDGFTITGGFANGGGIDDQGAGIFVNACNATIANCTVQSNVATTLGGGIFIIDSPSTSTITNCNIALNTAVGGGGIYLIRDLSPTMITMITNCIFDLNNADDGGAIYDNDSISTIITNCTFQSNEVTLRGGGIYNFETDDSNITNCVFSGNSTDLFGGAITNNNSDSTITNCTFSGNHSDDEGGAIFNFSCNPTITNCILWGNTASTGKEIYNTEDPSSSSVSYCDIEGSGGSGGGWDPLLGIDDGGNIDAIPLFVGGLDYRITAGSPAIDAGDNTALPADLADLDEDDNITEEIPFDLDYNLRRFDVVGTPDTGVGPAPIVDMGAYELLAYTVEFVANAGGSIDGTTTQVVPHGGDCTAVAPDPDENYHFVDWTGDHTGTEDPLTVTGVTSNMTIYANFAIDTYTVEFVANAGGSIDGTTTQVVPHGGDCTAVAPDPDENYHFVDWTGDHTGTEDPLTVTNVTSDMTIYANFAIDTFTVTFEAGTGGSIDGTTTQVVPHGGDCTAVVPDPDENYHFVDWTGDHTGTEDPLTVTNVTSDMTIYANFAIDTFTVTFEAGTGGSIDGTTTQVVPHGGDCTAVAPDPDENYHFVDWTGDHTGTEDPLTVTNVTSDMTIYANFAIDTFTVTFEAGTGGSIDGTTTQVVPHGGDCTAVAPDPDENYHFVDWTGDHTGTEDPLTVTNVTSDMTIYANFAIDTFTVTFEAGTGGSIDGTTTQVVPHGGDCTAVAPDPDENYHFVDWTGDHTGTEDPLTVTNVTSDMTIYANFAIDTFTVTFEAGTGGSIDGTTTQVVPHGGDCTAVAPDPDENYHFVDWTGDHTGTEDPLTVTNVTSDMTIYANFAIDTFTVTFEAGTGGSIDGTTTQVVPHGGDCTAVAPDPDENYHFVDWTGDHTGTEDPLTVTGVTSDMTIYANFAIDTYTVEFVSGANGNVAGDLIQENVPYGGSCTEVRAVPDFNYHLVDWTDPGGFNSTDNPLTVNSVLSDMTITANFAIDTYQVSDELAVDFGGNGLRHYDGSTWTEINGQNPEGMEEWDGGLASDFGTSGLWNYDGSSWNMLTTLNPQGMKTWTNGLAVDFSSTGLWNYNGLSWDLLTTNDPQDMESWTNGLAVDFGTFGLWNYNGSSWNLLTTSNAEGMAAWSGGLAVDFGTFGLWNYNGSSWDLLTTSDAQSMEAWSGGLAVDFDTFGLWNYDGSSWGLLTTSNAELMAAWADGIAVDFGGTGLWSYDGLSWDLLTTSNPQDMEGWASSLAVDLGTSGLWDYNGSAWSLLTTWDPEDMIDVDLY